MKTSDRAKIIQSYIRLQAIVLIALCILAIAGLVLDQLDLTKTIAGGLLGYATNTVITNEMLDRLEKVEKEC